ncbi:hypothetical protein, partial [Mumia xiangluensis]
QPTAAAAPGAAAPSAGAAPQVAASTDPETGQPVAAAAVVDPESIAGVPTELTSSALGDRKEWFGAIAMLELLLIVTVPGALALYFRRRGAAR